MSENRSRITFRAILTPLLVLSIAGHAFSQDQRQETPSQIKVDRWIILPDSVHPYRNPDVEAELSNHSVAYPRTIQGRIVHDGKTGDWIEFELNGDSVALPRALVVRKIESADDSPYSIIGSERLDRNRPLPLEYVPGDLTMIKQQWNFHDTDYSKYVRVEVAQAVQTMLAEARRDGIHIRLFSAHRSSEKQRYLYLKQIEKKGLTQNSVAKPGHSEHQLGTAVDLCGPAPESVASYEFDRTKEGKWIEGNAQRFGFVRSYTRENQEETGIIPEPWHYRYVGTDHRE